MQSRVSSFQSSPFSFSLSPRLELLFFCLGVSFGDIQVGSGEGARERYNNFEVFGIEFGFSACAVSCFGLGLWLQRVMERDFLGMSSNTSSSSVKEEASDGFDDSGARLCVLFVSPYFQLFWVF